MLPMLFPNTFYRQSRSSRLAMMVSRALGNCSRICIMFGFSSYACGLRFGALLDEL